MNMRKMMFAVIAALAMAAAFAQTSVAEKKLGKTLEKNKDASAVFVSEIDMRGIKVAADGRVTIPLLAKNKIVIVSGMDMTSIAERIAASKKSKLTATFKTINTKTKTYALTNIAGIAGAKPDTLISAAESNNVAEVRRLIAAGANVNAKDNNGVTALMGAAQNNAADVAKLLIEAKADVNAKNNNGVTALMGAAQNNAANVAKLLIEAKADVNAKDNNGVSTLEVATENKAADVATLLTAAGAKNLRANSIAVPAPKGVNLGDGADWIPLFIQGVITSNFQLYSGLTVVDRQNADMVKAEQKLSESAEFDEKNTLELGKMTSARFIVTGNIMAKSNAYALTFSITDAETGETKASASVPNCLRSALEDGSAANQISYDLMTGYGIALGADAKTKLTQTASVMAAEMSAQTSVAKGIAAEQSGSNIEALTYYIQAKKNDSKLSEATSRMAGMTTVVAGGNFGANAKNLIKLRSDWDKLLLEAAGLIAANPPEFEVRYFTDIEPLELTEENYNKGTMSFRVGAPYFKQTSGAENGKIAKELLTSMEKIEQSKNWGAKMNGFPWTYADDIAGDNWLKWANANKTETYPCTVAILDASKKTIAKKPYTLYVKYDKKYTGLYVSSSNSSKSSLTFSDVPVGNADTDKIYISVENTGSKKISVLPLPSDYMPEDAALKVLKNGSHNGTVKIGGSIGYLGDISRAVVSGKKTVALDLAEIINVTEIDNYAFDRCTSLKSIVIPDGVTTIGIYAFYDCRSLASVTIPMSVTKIDSSTFSNTSLRKIYYAGSEAQWNKISGSEQLRGAADIIYNYKGE